MAATIQIQYFGNNASEPAGTNVTSGGSAIKMNKADSLAGTTPIVKPSATGTAFSFVKQLALAVTATAATTIGTLQVKLSAALTSGFTIGFLGHATYLDQTGGTGAGSDSGSNGAVPSGYTAMTTSYQTYDSATGISAGTTGRKGNFCRIAMGVDNTYAGGAGSALALGGSSPVFDFQYTEA